MLDIEETAQVCPAVEGDLVAKLVLGACGNLYTVIHPGECQCFAGMPIAKFGSFHHYCLVFILGEIRCGDQVRFDALVKPVPYKPTLQGIMFVNYIPELIEMPERVAAV